MGTVISIHRVAKKHGSTELLQEASFLKDFGLEGDSRSKRKSGRQITLIEEEALIEVAKTLNKKEIPAGASRRQVMVRGISLNATCGKQIRVGSLLLEVTDLCHPCNNMEKTIGPGARAAMENRGGICARVIEGGTLKPGDSIQVL